MKLRELPVLIMDVQTSGFRPSSGRIIDFAWAVVNGREIIEPVREQQFEVEGEIPEKIRELVHCFKESEAHPSSRPRADLWFSTEFQAWQSERPDLGTAVIHGAQFEKAFLESLMAWPEKVICTQSLTRRFLADLPSANLRAVAGYFGHPVVGPNRALSFTLGTAAIWRGLLDRMLALGIETVDDLTARLESNPKKPRGAKRPFTYRLPDFERLHLPSTPGIYKMKTKAGDILYVGKATSLKSRVNSYFRGRKNRDRKKLEMLAQVWSIDVEECRTPLEAALLETDEIKRLDPPYNIALKVKDRRLIFYSRDFNSSASVQSAEHPYGPYRPGHFLEFLEATEVGAKGGDLSGIFFNPIALPILNEGFELFQSRWPKARLRERSFRDWLAFAVRLHRHFGGEPPTSPDSETAIVDADYVAGKFERLFRRAGGEWLRTRALNKALNVDVIYRFKGRELRLYVQHGEWKLKKQPNLSPKKFPWSELSVETYDRLAILLNELSRLNHRILRQREVET